MRFSSNVQEAVAESVQQAKPLIVVIGSDGDELVRMMTDRVECSEAVGLRLNSSGPGLDQFRQIFSVEVIPSVHVVSDGRVVERVGPSTEALVEALSKHVECTLASKTETNMHQPKPRPAAAAAAAAAASSRSSKGNLTDAQKSYQRQVQQAKQQKLEEKKRILRRIELDRKERESRDKNKQNSNMAFGKTVTEKKEDTSGKASLSIRLFDGVAVKQVFLSEKKLNDVRNWLDKNRTDGNQAYSFYQTFPKKLFGQGEEQQTLKELGLSPSATLILKPASAVFNAQNNESWVQYGQRLAGNAMTRMWGYRPVSNDDLPEEQQTLMSRDDDKKNDKRHTDNGNATELEDDSSKKNE